ncbi:MAG TPA: tripartite tricarboxylate transporter permease [Micropepsaceae bacterium]|nr:tripartite tricarboxylate transporter permease [Micropepsaceae bacterium]
MEEFARALEMLVTTSVVPAAIGGLIWGMLGGATPGLSASITMALLLPFTYTMAPMPAIVMLATCYIGAEYGGSIPAILIRTPGTNASAATMLDGFEMNRQGRAGEALGISLWSGVVGGLFGLTMLVLLTEPLSRLALLFKPTTYFGLGILGLSVIASLSSKSLLKGLAAAILGLMVATIGTDPVSGVSRFTFGSPDLLDGIQPLFVMVGLYAVTELMTRAGVTLNIMKPNASIRVRLPRFSMMKKIARSQAIGCTVGTFEGLMPGAGGTIASFIAYDQAKRWSKHPEEFGHGAEEGVAGPEAANNTVASAALIPLLSFGIPASNSAAVLLGGLLIHGLLPGPRLFEQNSDVVLGLYTGSFVADIAQVAIGIAILPLCIWLVNRPKAYRSAFILALVMSGVYTVHMSLFDVGIVLAAGMLGYFMKYFDFPFLPAVLGVVLGNLVESNYRRSLVLSGGDFDIFFQDPIAVAFFIVAAIIMTGALLTEWRAARARKAIPA